jgi:hypothetical protein
MSECHVRALSQRPELAALFAANPGEKATKVSTLKGLHLNPTPSGLIGMNLTPRVDRKKRGLPWALRINRFAVVSQNADWGCSQRGRLINSHQFGCGRRPRWEICGVLFFTFIGMYRSHSVWYTGAPGWGQASIEAASRRDTMKSRQACIGRDRSMPFLWL